MATEAALITQFQKTIKEVQDCIIELRRDFEETSNTVNDDSQSLQRLCWKLEYLFQAGLRVRTGLLGGKKDYWNYICDCASGNKSLSDGLRYVKTLAELKTSLGKGRAFIRYCLVHQQLADTIQQCILNGKVTSEWYEKISLWMQPQLATDLISALYELNEVRFDLPSSDYDLDDSWPSFTSKTLGAAYVPSSSNSVAKNPPSTASKDGAVGLAASSSKTKPEIDGAHAEAIPPVQEKVDKPTENVQNSTLASNGTSEQTEKTVNFEKELLISKMMCQKYQIECEQAKKELESGELKWREKEHQLCHRLEESQKTLLELMLKTDSATPAGVGNLTSNETAIKIMTLEKQLQATSMELESCKRQISMLKQVDEKKSQLLALMDKKIKESDEKKNVLCTKLESLIEDKTATTDKLVIASDQMSAMAKVMEDREKYTDQLKDSNKQLQEMLHSLEEKCSKVANLAKEKVTKYSEENALLKETIEQMKREASSDYTGNDEAADAGATSSRTLHQEREEVLVRYLGHMENFYDILANIKNSNQLEESNVQKALESCEELRQGIKQDIGGLKQELQDRSESGYKTKEEEIDGLKSENTELRTLVQELTDLLKTIRSKAVEREEEEKKAETCSLEEEATTDTTEKTKEVGE